MPFLGVHCVSVKDRGKSFIIIGDTLFTQCLSGLAVAIYVDYQNREYRLVIWLGKLLPFSLTCFVGDFTHKESCVGH